MPDPTTTTTTWGRPFQPGQSGNPRGRPRIGETVAEYIRGKFGPEARELIEQLGAIATGAHRDTKVRIEAIRLLLAYGFGKPLESLNISGQVATLDPTKLARLSDAELEQAAAIVAKLTSEG